jgi:hypothetical protein
MVSGGEIYRNAVREEASCNSVDAFVVVIAWCFVARQNAVAVVRDASKKES